MSIQRAQYMKTLFLIIMRDFYYMYGKWFHYI